MNLKQINEIRAQIGLPALPVDRSKLEAKRRNERNRAARGAESRELRARRTSGKR